MASEWFYGPWLLQEVLWYPSDAAADAEQGAAPVGPAPGSTGRAGTHQASRGR